MGGNYCINVCKGPETKDHKIKEAWEDCALTNLSSEEYVKMAIKYLNLKDYETSEKFKNFLDKIMVSKNHFTFFKYLKEELSYFINLSCFKQMIMAFFFLTKSKSEENMNYNFNNLIKAIVLIINKVTIDEFKQHFHTYKEIFEVYIRLISINSLQALKNSQIELNGKINISDNIDDEKLLNIAFEPTRVGNFKNDLLFLPEFSINNLILIKYEQLNHNIIRNNLMNLAINDSKDKEVKNSTK